MRQTGKVASSGVWHGIPNSTTCQFASLSHIVTIGIILSKFANVSYNVAKYDVGIPCDWLMYDYYGSSVTVGPIVCML